MTQKVIIKDIEEYLNSEQQFQFYNQTIEGYVACVELKEVVDLLIRSKSTIERLQNALEWAKPYVARLRDTEIIDKALSANGDNKPVDKDKMLEEVALAIEETMFMPHELPLDSELHGKYLITAQAALEVFEKFNKGVWDGR